MKLEKEKTVPPRKPRNLIPFLIGGVVIIIFFIFSIARNLAERPIAKISYDAFIAELGTLDLEKYSNIKEVTIVGMEVTGRLHKAVELHDIRTGRIITTDSFRTTLAFEDPDLIRAMEAKGMGIIFKAASPWGRVIFNFLLPVLFIVFLWIMFIRYMQAGSKGAIAFGKSKAKLLDKDIPKVTFSDVAGIDESKEELQEIVSFLKWPERYRKLGAKIPKGVLLYGPPGCGKTLLAKAIAGEANVSFFNVNGSDFVEMFVGVGASRVRDVFEQGRKHAPSIIFIDEIDAVGRQRFSGIGGGHDEREQTLNQLLAEMDGFSTQEAVIVIAATNRMDVLDAALLRPGRFDRQVEVYSPDLRGREEILKVHTKGIILGKSVDLKLIARKTPGFFGADMANVANEAALLAARKDKKAVGAKEFMEAIERVIAGPERRSRIISDYEKSIVAYHESGHALLALLISEADPLHKVSIIPRGGRALGYTLQFPLEDRYLTTKKELLGRVVVFLGGRVAEQVVFNESTTGAQNDLEIATKAIRKMVCEFGMSEKLGPMTFRDSEDKLFLGRDITRDKHYSDKIALDIDNEVRSLIDKCYHRAETLLKSNREKLDKLAATLKEHEVLDGDKVQEIVGIKRDTALENR
ncbi:MAG: ATP-dependent zinc metalloprotease FtsH [Syntrophomonadaceae bacterium]|nr:ATP-dependent zinc metalloprotease FtsH [Bacillota bacterium]